MPLFGRRASEPKPLTFTVGVSDHRVIVGTAEGGCRILEDVDQYTDFIARKSGHGIGGRDTVGVLNAKLDYAELVDTMVSVLVLMFEELVERGLIDPGEVPQKPAPIAIRRDIATYEYIQEVYQRAERRCQWTRNIDAILRQRDIAVLWPQS
ncbi:MAG: hypothetical protein JOY80_12690 [Candidatus Dormibacteraeota bacterium]|nr:hypothetical protein [Candidatus Dormibacteraeota bacterium]